MDYYKEYAKCAYGDKEISIAGGGYRPITGDMYNAIRNANNFIIDYKLYEKSMSPTDIEVLEFVKNESDMDYIPEDAHTLEEALRYRDDLALPFKNCFISLSDGNSFYYSQVSDIFIDGLHVLENGFNKYELFVLMRRPSKGFRITTIQEKDIGTHSVIHFFLKKFIELVNRFPVGEVDTPLFNVRVKGQGIKQMKPARTIYVSSQRNRKAKFQYDGRKTTWFFRFPVRGHWRRFFIEGTEEIDYSKTGKDREGNYVVKGMTWVVDHIVGPDDAPLIKQTRVVKNPVFLDDEDWDDDLDEETSNPVFDKWDSASIAALEGQYFNKLPDQYPYEAYVYLSRELSPYPDKKRGIIKKVDIVKRSGKVLYYQSGSHIVRIRPWNVALTREELITRFGLE